MLFYWQDFYGQCAKMNRLSHIRLLILVTFVVFAVSACGGGDADRPEPTTVLVNAGPDIVANEQSTVSLLGDARESGNAAATLTYTWSAAPTLTITQEDVASSSATLTTPVTTEVSEYVLTLTVSNESGVQGSDSITLSVNPVNISPIANIVVSQNETYETDTFPINSDVVFDASQSSDADPQTDDAEISEYLWQQTAGPDLLSGKIVTASSLTVRTPILASNETATIVLNVTDQEGAISQQEKSILLLSESQTIPELSIVGQQTHTSGDYIALSGSASSEARGAAPYSVIWSSDSSLAPLIADFNSFNTYSVAPLVSQETEVIYQFQVTDSYGNQQIETQTMRVKPPVQSKLNDTGVTVNATNIELSDAYQGEFAGQDAHLGRDRMEQSGLLDKAGRGDVGFDFTRLNQNGDEIDQETTNWRCVRDNTTGLIWENKNSDPTDLHYQDNLFTWFIAADNGGFAGFQNLNSLSCNLTSGTCNTQAYIDQVNAQGLCGFFDWRLPSHTELLSLVHFGKSQGPLVDSEYFPDMGSISLDPLWYWTSLPNVDGVSEIGSQSAWAIDVNSGVDNFILKSSEVRIKLVRAGR